MKTMKKMLVLMLAAAMLLSIAACAATTNAPTPSTDPAPAAEEPTQTAEPSAEKESLEVWAISSGTETDQYLRDFASAHPEVDYTITFYSDDDLKTQSKIALDSGIVPDVFFGHAGADFSEYYASGVLKDITQLIKDNGTYDRIESGYYGPYTVDDKIYGYPEAVLTPWQSLYVNRDIFDACGITEDPTTVDELIATCNTIHENGYAPILFEQGDAVEERTKKVEDFWKNGDPALDIRSNVQFGEGGAGTFSDGQLNTLVKDTSGRNGKVLSTFVEMGADPSILYDHAPHIGTDVLRDVVRNLRNRIIAGGGEVHFRSEVTEILEENGRVSGVKLADGTVVETEKVILSVGHSARDLFEKLDRMKVFMEPKPFAVGLRIQHPQAQINRNQYGLEDAGKLGAAPYKVTAKTTSGRGVYSFCMCPGGMVVNASSEKGRLAVNGMSNFKRDSGIANSALIVAVTPADFPTAGPLGGIAFQRTLEERAFALGGGKIPVQLYGDFAANRPTVALGDVKPVFCGGYSFANLRELMPEALNGAFLEGMEQFGRRIRGFDRADAVLAGIESRTSSPLRICRDESLQSSLKGLYPCGEGAGYAGGITSAAMDGLKVAEEIIKRYAAVG